MRLWWIDVFDKHSVKMVNLSEILKEIKIEQEKKYSFACEK